METRKEVYTPANASRRVGIGIIGCGWIAEMIHLPSLSGKIGDANLVAVADTNEEKAKRAGEKYGAKFWYTDHKELLRNSEVEAVWICTPPNSHACIAIDAINAGKHVMCEVPIATTTDDADAVIAAAKSARVKLMVGYYIHFGPIYLKAKELIEIGEIGRPVMISYNLLISRESWGAGKPWAWNLEEGGHVDFAITEPIDLMLFFLNRKVKRVYSDGGALVYRDRGGVEDNLVTLLGFDGDAIGMMKYSASVTDEFMADQVEIIGSEGVIYMKDNYQLTLYKRDQPQRQDWLFSKPFEKPSWGHLEADKHFIECIIKDSEPKVTGEYTKRILKIVTASVKSREIGSPIELEV